MIKLLLCLLSKEKETREAGRKSFCSVLQKSKHFFSQTKQLIKEYLIKRSFILFFLYHSGTEGQGFRRGKKKTCCLFTAKTETTFLIVAEPFVKSGMLGADFT